MITRSPGTVVSGWFGPRPGGGYEGATPALDAVVMSQAEWLAAEFGGDVEVRFNANRLSGGAYLVDPYLGNAGVGLGVRLDGDALTYDVCVDPVLARGVTVEKHTAAESLAAARVTLLATVGTRARVALDAGIGCEDVAVGDVVRTPGRESGFTVIRVEGGLAYVADLDMRSADVTRAVPLPRVAAVIRNGAIHEVTHKMGRALCPSDIRVGDWVAGERDDAVVVARDGDDLTIGHPSDPSLEPWCVPAERVVTVHRGVVAHAVAARAASGEPTTPRERERARMSKWLGVKAAS